MAQLSRPYQIALAAIAVLAVAWFAVLRSHNGGPNASSPSVTSKPSAPSSSATAASEAREAAKPSHIYKGSAPGVEGLTRDIAKAHGAVATSQRNAAELQRKSAQASDEAPAAGNGSASAAKATHAKATHAKTGAGAATAPSHSPSTTHTAANTPSRPAEQVQVERELTHGKTVVLVFWNPSASVDQTVRSQALTLAGASKGRVTVHTALAKQVGLFGPVTEVAHVYETPTVLIVARRGLVSTLTGLIDSYGLQQAVREAEHASK